MTSPTMEDVFRAVLAGYENIQTKDSERNKQLHDMQRSLREHFTQRPRYLTDAAKCCVDRFVASELDYRELSARGVGRTTDHPPRLVVRHHGPLSALSPVLLQEIEFAIKRHVMCVYFLIDMCFEIGRVDEADRSADDLFAEWVPQIYVTTMNDLVTNDDLRGTRDFWFGQTCGGIVDAFRKARVDWDFSDTLDSDQCIVTHYYTAGMLLRMLESSPMEGREALPNPATLDNVYFRCELHFHQQDQVSVFMENNVPRDAEAFWEAFFFCDFAIRQMSNLGPSDVADSVAHFLRAARENIVSFSQGFEPGGVKLVSYQGSPGRRQYLATLTVRGQQAQLEVKLKGFGWLGTGHGYYAPTSVVTMLRFFAQRRRDSPRYLVAMGLAAKACGDAWLCRRVTLSNHASLAMEIVMGLIAEF